MASLKLSILTLLAFLFINCPVYCAAAGEGGNQPGGAGANPEAANQEQEAAGPAHQQHPDNQRQGAAPENDEPLVKLVVATDKAVKDGLVAGVKTLNGNFHSHYDTYSKKLDAEHDKDYLEESNKKDGEHKKKVEDALEKLEGAKENWHDHLGDVQSALVEYNEFVQGVFEKAHDALKGDKEKEEDAKNFEHDNLKHKAENLKGLLALFDVLVTKSHEELNNDLYNDAKNERKENLKKNKEDYESAKAKVTELAGKVNEDKEKAKDHFKELKEKVKEARESAKAAYDVLLEARKDKEVDVNKELQTKLHDFVEELANVSRSFLPGFVAIALSLALLVVA